MTEKGYDYHVYAHSLAETWTLLTKHFRIYVPDLLFLATTAIFIWIFLTTNDLLQPLLSSNRISALQESFKTIIQSTPAFTKLIVSTLILLFVNLSLGVTFINTRFLLIRAYLHKQPLNLKKAFKESSSYFWRVLFIKLVFFILYLIPLLIFFTILFWNRQNYTFILPFALTLLVLMWFMIKFLFFFTYPILFLKEKSIKALMHAATYSKTQMQHTFITIAILTVISFFLNMMLSLFPQAWFRIALSTNLLSLTSTVLVLYFIVSRFTNLIYNLFESSFTFTSYFKRKN